MKKLTSILSIAVLLVMAVPVLAQTGDQPVDDQRSRDRGTQSVDLHERVEEARQQRERQVEEFEERRQNIKEDRQRQLEERQAQVDARVSDRVAERAENIANRLNTANANMTDAYLRHLDRVEMVLDKVLSRANKFADERDIDISRVEQLAGETYAEIDRIRNAVLFQKEKVYSVSVSSVDELGPALRELIAEFREDHRVLRSQLQQVRESVREVFAALQDAVNDLRDEDNDDTEEDEE